MSRASSKLFGRYHEVALLTLGFVLTTLVGGFLGSRYQQGAWERQDRAQRQERAYDRAAKAFDDISVVMDRRLYRLRAVVWAIKDRADPAVILERRRAYRDAVDEWNESLNRNLSITELSFSSELRSELEGNIRNGFNQLHESLVGLLKKPTVEAATALDKQIDAFNVQVYYFDRNMLERLASGSVGESTDKSSR